MGRGGNAGGVGVGATKVEVGDRDAKYWAEFDVDGPREEYVFAMPSWVRDRVVPCLDDKRDEAVAALFFNITVTTVPAAIALYVLPPSHLLGAAYVVANLVTFLQRFILGLHCVEHRRLFKPDSALGWFHHVPNKVFAPLFGIPAGMYRLHHIIMHHTENNLIGYDLSSTEPFQRDNFFHFLFYWVRFWVAAWIELPYYALRRKRFDVFADVAAVEVSFVGLVYALNRSNPVPTLYVFVIPFFIASFALMLGNWCQHALINPAKPRSNFGLTVNCLNSFDNRRTFNDGYHIVHHSNSKLHWTEMPQRFLDTMDKHREEDAWAFVGVSFMEVGVACMLGKYKWVAGKLATMPGTKRPSDDEIVAEIKLRLQPIRQVKAK